LVDFMNCIPRNEIISVLGGEEGRGRRVLWSAFGTRTNCYETHAGFHNQWIHFVRYIGFVIALAGILVLVSVLGRAVVEILNRDHFQVAASSPETISR
jgi:hypothetical protein